MRDSGRVGQTKVKKQNRKAKPRWKNRQAKLAESNEYRRQPVRCANCSTTFVAAGKQKTHCPKCIDLVAMIAKKKKQLAIERKLDQIQLKEILQ